MSAGWFDPTLGAWFDETEQEAGWFDASLVDEESSGGGGTIAAVQSAHGEAGSGTSPTATFSSDVTSGNLLVVVASAYRAGTPPHAFSLGDLTKSSGTATLGTAQLDIQHARSTGSNEGRVAIWSIPVTGTGSLTLSLAVNTGDYANIAAEEFSGADTSSGRLDTSLSNDGPGTGTEMLIGDMTSAGAGVFVGGFAAYTSTTTTWTPNGAFTTIYNVGDVAYNASAAIYQIVSGATTDSCDAQISPNFDAPGWAGASVVYKAASGGSDLSLSLDAGAITVAGQSITAAINAALTNGTVTVAGQSLTFAASAVLSAGAITLAGQDLTLSASAGLSLTLDAGAITVAGQGLSYSLSVPLAAGSITVAGQALTLSAGGNLSMALDAGQVTMAGQDVAFAMSGQPEAEQPSGGYGWANLVAAERRRNKRQRELEEEADRLEMALAAEGLTTPAPEVVARFTVREYANAADTFSRRTQRAIAYAERAQTALAYELAARQLQKEIDDEESAIAMLLALVA